MPDYPPGYDPSQVESISAEDQAIGAMISLAALGAVGVGAFFTLSALGAGTAITEGVVVNGTVYYGVSIEVATAIDAATTLETTAEADAIMNAAMVAAAAARASITSAALIILAAQQNEREAQGMFFPSGF